MKSAVLAITAALATAVVAQPHGHQHQKHHLKPRADGPSLVIVTEYESTTTTIGVTTTIWVTKGEVPTPPVAAPTPSSSSSVASASSSSKIAAQFFEPPAKPSTPTTLVSVAPVPASTYIPPPPSSTSVAPPPPAPTTPSSVASVASVAPVVQAPAVQQAPASVPKPAATSAAPVVAPAATSAAPVASAASSGGSSGSSSSAGALLGQRGGSTVSGGVCTEGSPCEGKGTYYDTIGTGSCGQDVDGTTVPIVALPKAFMEQKEGANPNNNPYCNKGVTISYNGKTVNAYVFDKCPGCSDKAIDLSHAAFKALAPDYETLGHVQMDWWFN